MLHWEQSNPSYPKLQEHWLGPVQFPCVEQLFTSEQVNVEQLVPIQPGLQSHVPKLQFPFTQGWVQLRVSPYLYLIGLVYEIPSKVTDRS